MEQKLYVVGDRSKTQRRLSDAQRSGPSRDGRQRHGRPAVP